MLFISFYLYLAIIPVSSRLWNPRGRISCHSMDVGMCCLVSTGRCVAKASQIMKINIIRAVKDSIDPIDDTTFHFMKASG